MLSAHLSFLRAHQAVHGLAAFPAHGDNEDTALHHLIDQGPGDLWCAAGDDDLLEGRMYREALVAVAMMAAVLALYANIAGAEAAWEYYMGRWAERGSFVPGAGMPSSSFIIGLPIHVFMSFGPLVLLIVLGSVRIRGGPKAERMRPAWWWMVLPAALHILVFLRYTGHQFAVLCLGFVLCAWAAFALARWKERKPTMAMIAFVTTCFLGIALYTVQNRPGDGSATGDRYDVAMERGLYIAGHSRMEERIYVTGTELGPQILWYARRNMSDLPIGMDSSQVGDGRCPEVHFIFSGDDCMVVRPGE